ncbi:MAG: SOS response-associated peptidase [Bacteroidota bacterium]
MCGRYSIGPEIESLVERLNIALPPDFAPHYNAAPSQHLPVVSSQQPDKISRYQWGMIPFWAKSPGQRLINARAETVNEKSTFKRAFRSQRCLVPASGYYEWKKTPQGKEPYRIVLSDKSPFVFAGIWQRPSELSTTEASGSDLPEYCIITTATPSSIKNIHDRMPVVLDEAAWDFWLSDTEDDEGLQDVLRPLKDDQIKAYPVSKRVNNVRNDDKELIEVVYLK